MNSASTLRDSSQPPPADKDVMNPLPATLDEYQFPLNRIQALSDPSKTPLVLVAWCVQSVGEFACTNRSLQWVFFTSNLSCE